MLRSRLRLRLGLRASLAANRCLCITGTDRAKQIETLLIANRGEIACRIMRTTAKLGIRSVAVFSEADRDSLHSMIADESYCIGPAPSTESYLRADKILEVAKNSGADAVHPGYGFLSENGEFADACESAGVTFVGPPSSAIRDMGLKDAAKRIMEAAGVPVVTGYHGTEQGDELLLSESRRIGFPVMLKAVRGGGGKGMRIAHTEAEFADALSSARRESAKAFGNDDMIVEKYVVDPRHVEVQVFGDAHGNYVYLFERDCSVQRRHQKIVEEAPGPGISEETRKALGEAAVKAAQAVEYQGAGTVEFIMDKEHNFYFMEMNTRLQVEHPVSEMITGTDLVEWQIRVAEGHPLPIPSQENIIRRGHSFEARIYAEDPENNFMPGAGRLSHLRPPDPSASTHMRVETGVREGDEVSVHYDPMIAKLVVWGPDRETALYRLDSGLRDYHLVGLKSNINFIRSLITHPQFRAGNVYTGFIADYEADLFPKPSQPSLEVVAEAVGCFLLEASANAVRLPNFNPNDPFSGMDAFRLNLTATQSMKLTCGGETIPVQVSLEKGLREFTVSAFGQSLPTKVELMSVERGLEEVFELLVETKGRRRRVKAVVSADAERLHLFTDDGHWEVGRAKAAWRASGTGGSVAEAGAAQAPMPGVVEKVLVKSGDVVTKGQQIVVLVAMKMEYAIRCKESGQIGSVGCGTPGTATHGNIIKITAPYHPLSCRHIVFFSQDKKEFGKYLRAPRDGEVEAVECQEGESVAKGAVLFRLKEDNDQADTSN